MYSGLFPLCFMALCASVQTFWLLSHLKLSSISSDMTSGHGGSNRMLCELIPGLDSRQRRICEKHPQLIRAVLIGAQMGISECQHQFHTQRWNCTNINPSVSRQGIANLLFQTGSREAAFVYAISSAGAVHVLARACADGSVAGCSCGKARLGVGLDAKGNFHWGGCSDNLRYASRFARKFIDSADKRNHDPVALMNLHNYRAGRRAVRKSVNLQCKCHGVSGSCTTRTCWKAVGAFRSVGNRVFRKYRRALRVRIQQRGRSLIPADETKHYDSVIPMDDGSAVKPKVSAKLIKKADLVYFEPSPDYCITDESRGSIGTAGRVCNRTSSGPDNCNIMCCGRGYDTKTEKKTFKCHCRFTWCCKVECRTCSKEAEIYTCKSSEPYKAAFTDLRFRGFKRRYQFS